MVFCSKCGKELAEDAYYCSKCGIRTDIGKAAGVRTPSEEIKEAFLVAGKEMEKAFSQVAKEVDQAFEKIKDVRSPKLRDCSKCGEKNIPDAYYCPKCGNKL